MRKIILMTVCALVAQTVISQQYFSKRYPESPTKGNFANNIFIAEKGYLKQELVICTNNRGCAKYVFTDKFGINVKTVYKDYFNGNRFSTVCRNDTIFYSGRSNDISKDSIFYWYFGMLSSMGDSIAEYKIKILHLNDVGIGSFGVNEPLNYGLTVVNNSEVILYGEGIDKRMPNPGNVSYRALFIRLGLDGVQKGGNIWYELNENRDRRLGQVITDKDGEALFPYVQYEKDKITGLVINTSLIKMNKDNQFTRIAYSENVADKNFPTNIAQDIIGNYFTVTIYRQDHPEYNLYSSYRPYLTKIDKEGKVSWIKLIPHLYYQWAERIQSDNYHINRITTCQNGDILCIGSCFLSDSFYIPGVEQKVHLSRLTIPFMTRFDTDGNVVFHHFIAPQNKVSGDLMYNTLLDIKEDTDGSIIVAGQLQRDNPDNIIGDAWLMRLSPQGCLDATCSHLGKYWIFPDTIVSTKNTEITALAISPNPASDYFDIKLSDNMIPPLHYEIINIAGQRVEIGSHSIIDQMHIETDNLQAGLYIVQLRDKRGKVWRGKVVVE